MPERTAVEIWKELESKGVRVRYRPVAPEDLVETERALGLRLPPSYVELVTTVGAPAVLPRLPPRVDPTLAENLAFAVLTPREIVEQTLELRDSVEPEGLDDPGSADRIRAQLNGAVLFQYGLDPGEGFVFLVDASNAAGEPRVADFSHDYIEELDWEPDSRAVFGSLAAAQEHVVTRIVSQWDEYADTPQT